MQLVFVEARVAGGRLAEALVFLTDLLKVADLAAPDGQQAATAFLAGLRLALRHATEEALPSFSAAVAAFVWQAANAGQPALLLGLVRALVAQDDTAEVGCRARHSRAVLCMLHAAISARRSAPSHSLLPVLSPPSAEHYPVPPPGAAGPVQ